MEWAYNLVVGLNGFDEQSAEKLNECVWAKYFELYNAVTSARYDEA